MDEDNSELQSMINQIGVDKKKIDLLGDVNDLRLLINKLDLNILSSAGEAFPNIIGEAMSMKVLCVGTDVGDVSLIIGEFGWVVPKRNPVALSEAIISAKKEYNNYNDWILKSKKAKISIEKNYPIQLMLDSYYNVWHS